MSRGSRRLVLLAAGCACAVIGVSAASAGHHHHATPLKYVSRSAVLSPFGGAAAAIAPCPKHTAVIGGGTFPSGPNDGEIELNSSSPEPAGGIPDPTKGWIGYAFNKVEGGPDQSMNVYAICTPHKATLKYVSRSVTLPQQGQGASAVAPCPKHTTVTGGGTFSSGPNDGTIALSTSSPEPAGGTADPAKGWIGYAYNRSGADQTFTVYAICSSQTEKFKYVTRTTPLPSGFHVEGASRIVPCPKHTSVTGGGTFVSGPNDGGIELSASSPEPAGSVADPTKGWIGYANSDSGDQTLVVSAICMQP